MSASFRGVLTFRVRTNLLETLRPNRVVRSVSTFVRQPGWSALGILSGSSRRFCLLVFLLVFCLPGGIRGFDVPSALVIWSPFKIITPEKKTKRLCLGNMTERPSRRVPGMHPGRNRCFSRRWDDFKRKAILSPLSD